MRDLGNFFTRGGVARGRMVCRPGSRRLHVRAAGWVPRADAASGPCGRRCAILPSRRRASSIHSDRWTYDGDRACSADRVHWTGRAFRPRASSPRASDHSTPRGLATTAILSSHDSTFAPWCSSHAVSRMRVHRTCHQPRTTSRNRARVCDRSIRHCSHPRGGYSFGIVGLICSADAGIARACNM
jgi:hypothetical protein